jgi:phosphatidate cytidylyltransferase
MAKQQATLAKRILSSLVLAPLAIAAVFYGDWPYHVFLAFLFIIAVREWSMMALRLQRPFIIILLGICYFLSGFASFIIVRADPTEGLTATLVLLVTVWASDIGAYAFGKVIGGPKVAPRISPGKTYAGLSGSILAGAIVPPLAALSGHSILSASDMQLATMSSGDNAMLLMIGVFLGISGQCGDLLISFVKRKAGVKDTGALIPGHGGILDRIDALLLAGPVYLVFLMFCA